MRNFVFDLHSFSVHVFWLFICLLSILAIKSSSAGLSVFGDLDGGNVRIDVDLNTDLDVFEKISSENGQDREMQLEITDFGGSVDRSLSSSREEYGIMSQLEEENTDTIADLDDFNGRRWYFGGNFTSINGQTANGVMYFENNEFYTINGTGMNGPVYATLADSCIRAYFGGNFTHVNGTKSGPIARYSPLEDTWDYFFDDDAEWDPEAHNTVYSIAVHCYNKPPSLRRCGCDLFIGGSFVLKFKDGTNATNIARFSGDTEKWDNLGGAEKSGINDLTKPVRSLWRRDEDRNLVESAIWVGGEFDGFLKKRYLLSHNDSWVDLPGINGPVHKVDYRVGLLGNDTVIVGGNFNFTFLGTHCQWVCIFLSNRKELKWINPGPVSEGPKSPVHSFSFDTLLDESYFGAQEGVLYSSQMFRNGTYNYFANGITFPSDFQNSTEMISMYRCSSVSLGCNRGSISIVGTNNYLRLFDAKSKSWYWFDRFVSIEGGDILSSYSIFHGTGL